MLGIHFPRGQLDKLPSFSIKTALCFKLIYPATLSDVDVLLTVSNFQHSIEDWVSLWKTSLLRLGHREHHHNGDGHGFLCHMREQIFECDHEPDVLLECLLINLRSGGPQIQFCNLTSCDLN